MKIAVGCDPNAKEMKMAVIEQIKALGFEWEDLGSEDAIYANVAIQVAEAVAAGKYDRGILLCGTGIGMSIAANKVPGAYAALVSDAYSAERAAMSNNANIITLGAQTIGPQLAQTLTKAYLQANYTPGGRSEPKVQRITEYARQHSR